MKIPRDVSCRELCKLLAHLGYAPTRQSGSHIRLTTGMNGEHHITFPDHDSLRIGTLSAIPGDVAEHFGISKDGLSDDKIMGIEKNELNLTGIEPLTLFPMEFKMRRVIDQMV